MSPIIVVATVSLVLLPSVLSEPYADAIDLIAAVATIALLVWILVRRRRRAWLFAAAIFVLSILAGVVGVIALFWWIFVRHLASF